MHKAKPRTRERKGSGGAGKGLRGGVREFLLDTVERGARMNQITSVVAREYLSNNKEC